MKSILLMPVRLLLGLGLVWYAAIVLVWIWRHFAVPVGLPEISTRTAVGISLVRSWVLSSVYEGLAIVITSTQPEERRSRLVSNMLQRTLLSIFVTSVLWLSAWVLSIVFR